MADRGLIRITVSAIASHAPHAQPLQSGSNSQYSLRWATSKAREVLKVGFEFALGVRACQPTSLSILSRNPLIHFPWGPQRPTHALFAQNALPGSTLIPWISLARTSS